MSTSVLRDELQSTLGSAFQLDRELTGGAMSRVFLAHDAALGRPVVVKLLAPELAAGMDAERFRREIQVAARLQHPHIVPVLSAGEMDGVPYFVMPYVGGESLRARLLTGERLALPDIVAILRDVAKALAFAHAQGVVHRDIKPDNVLLSGGSAIVTDFGIAKALSSSRVRSSESSHDTGALTLVGTSLGTPAYMAPEQAAGDPATDHRADFYAFGVMAFELLAGRLPFLGDAPHALLTAHIGQPPPALAPLAPEAPDALVALVMHCLEKHPAHRPQSASEVLEVLAQLDGRATRSGSTIASIRSLRRGPWRRQLVTAAVLGAAALLVVGVVAAARWLTRDDRPLSESTVAVVPFRVATADPSLHYLRDGMLDLLAAKLSGEGGMWATEPRQLLAAWRRAGGSESVDLSRSDELRLARELGAGRLLLGDVVGVPSRVTLTATLLSVPEGTLVTRVSVEGPPDSLARLVDQLAAGLLTQLSDEGEQRISSLRGIPLTALRFYLSGQEKLRRGEAVDAARDFGRALDADSNFALAGIGLRLASSWYGDPGLAERGLRVAWRERERLAPRDRALLAAVAGPNYPRPSSTQEVYDARERYVAIAPDRAEAWYELADHLFHYGPALGIVDWRERALDGFRRAMALDSTYVVGYIHALPLAVYLGDSATAERAERLRLQSDTSAIWREEHRWYVAERTRDRAAAEAVWSAAARNEGEQAMQPFLWSTVSYALFDGTGAQDAARSIDEVIRRQPNESQRRQIQQVAHDYALVLGRPQEALRRLASYAADTANRLNALVLQVRDAMVGDGDLRAGDSAARVLEQLEAQPMRDDSLSLRRGRQLVRALEPWRLWRGDSTHTRRSLERLRRAARGDSTARGVEGQIEIALIEAMYADVARSPSAGRALDRLDSLLRASDYGDTHVGRTMLANYVAARLYEKRGDFRRALAAIRRRAVWTTQAQPYLATQLREEGRLAALAGEREEAERAYEQFVALRAQPEPTLLPQTEAARRALERLRAERG